MQNGDILHPTVKRVIIPHVWEKWRVKGARKASFLPFCTEITVNSRTFSAQRCLYSGLNLTNGQKHENNTPRRRISHREQEYPNPAYKQA